MEHLKRFDDVFGIEKRLREIDPRYRLFFNIKSKKYEVYTDCGDGGLSLAFVSPYDNIDSRIIKYARSTRVSRAEEIFAEIEENNQKIMKNAEENALLKSKSKIESIVSFLKKRGE